MRIERRIPCFVAGMGIAVGSAAVAGEAVLRQELFPGGADADPKLCDLDHDGRLDVFSIAYQRVATQLGDGFGRFEPKSSVAVAGGPQRSAIGDWNGDGHPDGLVATNAAIFNAIERIDGDGTGAIFAVGQIPILVNVFKGLALADVDLDGDLDVLVTSSAGISRITNAGNGAIGATTIFPTGTPQNNGLAISDLDLDGDPDAATLGLEHVVVMANSGGGFASVAVPSLGFSMTGIEAGDADADGDDDIVVSGSLAEIAVGLIRNQGAFSFANPSVAAGLVAPQSLRLADLDQDGRVEALTFEPFQRMLQVYEFPVGGPPVGIVAIRTVAAHVQFATGDLTGDLRPDVVLQSQAGTTVIEGDGFGSLLMTVDTTLPAGGALLALDDDDSDGNPDALIYSDTEHALFRKGDGALGFGGGASAFLGTVGPSAAADLDQDGTQDIVAVEQSFGAPPFSLSSVRGDGAGGFLAPVASTIPQAVQAIAVGRCDAGPIPDLVLATYHPTADAIVRVGVGDGAGGFAVPATGVSLPFRAGTIESADVNGDGFADLINADSLTYVIKVLLGDGNGSFSSVFSMAATGGTGLSGVGANAFDVTGDLVADLVTLATNAGACTFQTRTGDGAGGFVLSHQQSFPLACLLRNPYRADLDADGIVDVIATAIECDVLAYFRGQGGGAFDPPRFFQMPDVSSAILAGDLDGDGRPELAAVAGTQNLARLAVLTRACAGEAGNYGTGCPGSGGESPEIGLPGCASPGATVTLEIRNGLGGSFAILFFGIQEGWLPAAPDCALLVAPVLPLMPVLPLGGSGPGTGAIALGAVVPASLMDATVTMQAFVADGGVLRGFSATPGLAMRVKD